MKYNWAGISKGIDNLVKALRSAAKQDQIEYIPRFNHKKQLSLKKSGYVIY